jgi:DNA-directed RNA polymerase specialized sigma24 family protein
MAPSSPPVPTADAAIVVRCRAGEDAAWGELVDRYARYVFAIATQVYRLPAADAEDVFQDVFARVNERLDELRDDDLLRLRSREALDPEPVDPAGGASPFEALDEALAVRQALEELGGPCRDVLDRFFLHDESYEQIARATGLPPGTIASRISRCLAKLRTALAGRNPAP